MSDNYALIPDNWLQIIDTYNFEPLERLEFLDAMLYYCSRGIEPNFSSEKLRIAFTFIEVQQKLLQEKKKRTSEARSEAGKKGGATNGNQNARKYKDDKIPF